MKLNVMCNLWNTSGFAVHAKNLSLALSKAGVDVGVETNEDCRPFKDDFPEHAGPVERMGES